VRLQQAARVPSYTGTFVVSSAAGAMVSARIWHVCHGPDQLERVEALSGPPRATYRHNNEVVIFQPDTRTVRTEQRESSGGVFQSLLRPGEESAVARLYGARQTGQGRVAGFDADIVHMAPHDHWRYGYRIWSEKRTGLVVKMQTLDEDGRVLEQSAFSELQFNAPLQARQLTQMMRDTQGYRVQKPDQFKTTAEAEGWALKRDVPGFRPQHSYRRQKAGATEPPVVQWIFSDGLATVSLFMEPFQAGRHTRPGMSAMGATHTLMQRVPDASGAWWLTAVGEVPPHTLQAFADALERTR
ncbi:MAG: MucB/RseB C-terminal domain-containing protein, partial [Comamonadaceae bacterium]|nr:MucB/RseB C-terminal domain-containing protein [Comamonadaceae bacterium]